MIPHCFRLDRQLVWSALRLALAMAGSNMAARMAMMAITTSNSIKVNPRAPGDNFGSVFIVEQKTRLSLPQRSDPDLGRPNALLKAMRSNLARSALEDKDCFDPQRTATTAVHHAYSCPPP